MILEGPTVSWRDVRYGDEDAVLAICADWSGDGKRFTRRRAEQAVHKYVNDMTVQPGAHPVGPDDCYREALIAFTPSGDPLALIVYVVRGGNDSKNWPLAVPCLYTEAFTIAPDQRGLGLMDELLNTLIRSAFEDTGVEVLIHDLVDTAQMRSHATDRAYADQQERETRNGTRIRVSFTRAEHQARMAARPAERQMRHRFSME